jgi:hypothetical protein
MMGRFYTPKLDISKALCSQSILAGRHGRQMVGKATALI